MAIAGVSSRKGLSSVTVSYNEAVTASASNAAVYQVFEGVTKVVKKQKETVFTKALAIRAVSSNSGGNMVTINLAKPFKGTVQVTVEGTITAANNASNNISTSKIVK
jgi:hypothetical protein